MRAVAITWSHTLIDNRLAALHNQWLKLPPPKLSYEKPGIMNFRSPGGSRFATSLMNNPRP